MTSEKRESTYAALLGEVHDHNDGQRNQTRKSDSNKDEKEDEEVAQVIVHGVFSILVVAAF